MMLFVFQGSALVIHYFFYVFFMCACACVGECEWGAGNGSGMCVLCTMLELDRD